VNIQSDIYVTGMGVMVTKTDWWIYWLVLLQIESNPGHNFAMAVTHN